MKEELNMFCRNQDETHFLAAIKIKEELDEGQKSDEVLAINTKDLFE